MKRYYVYFDDYRRPRKAVTEEELLEVYGNDPAEFQKAMSGNGPEATAGHVVGHVGVLSFESEKELQAYLEEGEEIAGFYECRADSRPYNF
jgi:hypothetical protein